LGRKYANFKAEGEMGIENDAIPDGFKDGGTTGKVLA
jgi:hypothetical protein